MRALICVSTRTLRADKMPSGAPPMRQARHRTEPSSASGSGALARALPNKRGQRAFNRCSRGVANDYLLTIFVLFMTQPLGGKLSRLIIEKKKFRLAGMVQIRRTPGQTEAELDRAIDGDTLLLWVKVADDVKIRRRCRLIGIDSFEPDKADGVFAMDIAAKINALLDGEILIVEWNEGRIDMYGRNLVRISWRNADVGEIFKKNGWAWTFGNDDEKKHALRRHRLSLAAVAKAFACLAFATVTFAGCQSPKNIYAPTPSARRHGAALSIAPVQPASDSLIPTDAGTLTTEHHAPIMAIIERGGQLTITGDESPVSASDTSTAFASRGSYRAYAVAIGAGALGMLLLIVAGHIGWRTVIAAVKTALI